MSDSLSLVQMLQGMMDPYLKVANQVADIRSLLGYFHLVIFQLIERKEKEKKRLRCFNVQQIPLF